MAPRFDPIEEARRQWAEHGWSGLEAMSAAATLSRANQLVLGQLDRALKPFTLTFSRYEALVLLSFTRGGALPLGKMAERLMVHSTSVTNTIDRLERAGYVRRVPHLTDRRLILAEITDEGRGIVKQATDVLVEMQFGIPALPPQVLQRLADAVDHARRTR